jgi:hypothetical protein
MEMEHSSNKKFTTPNYGITTCPVDEWRIVIDVDKMEEKQHSRQLRKIPDWKQIMLEERMQAHKGNEAPLTDVEVIAIILYTGPMVSLPHSPPHTQWATFSPEIFYIGLLIILAFPVPLLYTREPAD